MKSEQPLNCRINLLNVLFNLLLLFLFTACKNIDSTTKSIQGKNSIYQTTRNTYVNDTFFLLRTEFSKSNNYEHFYRTHQDELYKELVPKINYKDFSLSNNPFPNEMWEIENQKVDIKNMPTLWTELIYYDEYYVNYPSDFCGLDQMIVTDSCLIVKTCEGPLPIKIREVKRPQNNQFRLELGFDGLGERSMLVTIIDSIRGIAIWEDSENMPKLMVDVSKVRNLPIVKADCNGSKCHSEIQSQRIDVEKLKKEAR